ncbi:MAG: hypothetical protein Q7V17_06130 [Afipia sp.]|nr:hypothetical protein [Afipia sp.]
MIEGVEAGPAEYDMTVVQGDTWKSADGTIEADMLLLMKAQSARKTQLKMRNGTVDIILTNVDSTGHGTFQVSGPVPGF